MINKDTIGIEPGYESLTSIQAESFMRFVLFDTEQKDEVFKEMIKANTIAKIAYTRYKSLENTLPIIDNDVFILIDIFAKGNPGKGMIMLYDITKDIDDKVTSDMVINKYALGFYNELTCLAIIDAIKSKKIDTNGIY